ncbi:MAG: tRNA lysidine(34) synthetase TilS [Bacteroidota bacterium]
MISSRVEKFLNKYEVRPHDRILVAVSGGADSMTLLQVLSGLGYSCQAAHCNFHLRDEDSDEDERFVFDYCLGNNIPLHVKHFDTRREALKRGVSIEMAARDLRYKWFWQLVERGKFSWLATGHHGDDMIETFFLNLARGTGLRGLRGMRECQDALIRPLLSFQRTEIESYCYENGIPFRTDISNFDTAYQRNNIRHNILPVMQMLNPSFFQTMRKNFKNIDDVWQIFEKEVHQIKAQISASEGDHMLIPIKLIKEHPQRETMLFEILRPYGFKGAVISKIINSFDGIPGKQFFSPDYRLVRDRFNLVLVPLEENKEEVFYIDSNQEEIREPLNLRIKSFEVVDEFKYSRDPDCVHVDNDSVEFPLKLRHWHKGDQFRPLGMKHFKKLSDFFVDEKLSRAEKDKVWLLLSGEDIVWVLGHRIDDRFKVTSSTRTVLEFRI